MLDRIDLCVEVLQVPLADLGGPRSGNDEDSATVRARVLAARRQSLMRAGRPNAKISVRELERDCALGPADMRAFLADLSRVAECLVGAYPNAGLPNAMGGYDETPHSMEVHYAEWARAGLLNIAVGCCGTTPDHITHMKHAVEGVKPRVAPAHDARLKLAGLEPFTAVA